jgi:phospholipid transport system transporter-binding protein
VASKLDPSHAPAFAVQAVASDTLALSGALTFVTAQHVLAQAQAAIAGRAPATLDLAGVDRADSAGLACVLAILASASQAGSRPRVVALPEGLRALARVSDVEMMLVG